MDTKVEANIIAILNAKLFAAIAVDIVCYTMFADYVFEIHLCYLWVLHVWSGG